MENLRSWDVKWLVESQVTQVFWLLLHTLSWSIGLRQKQQRQRGEDKGLVEETGWRQRGKIVGSPMQKQETEQRQVSTHGCIPGYLLIAPSLTTREPVRRRGTICHKESGAVRNEKACLRVLGLELELRPLYSKTFSLWCSSLQPLMGKYHWPIIQLSRQASLIATMTSRWA